MRHFILALIFLIGGCRTVDGLFAYGDIDRGMREPAIWAPGQLQIHDRLAVVHLYGTPEEMGRQYGQLLGYSLRGFHRFVQGFVPDLLKEHFMAYARGHEQYLPEEMRQELQAMAKAANVPYMELVAMNIVPKMTCSTLAAWNPKRGEDPHLIMGRNADYFSMGLNDRGMLVVVRHPKEGVATASVTFLGMVGAFTGMNAKGVAYGNMLVFNANGPERREDGLPIQLAMQLAAVRSESAQQMAKSLEAMRHVIPMNVMVADRKEAIALELGITEYRERFGQDGVLAASNYFRSADLFTEPVDCPRYNSLKEAGEAHGEGMSAVEMEQALYKARIKGVNLQAVVFEPAKMKMHVSINKVPAAKGPYTELDLNRLFQTQAVNSK